MWLDNHRRHQDNQPSTNTLDQWLVQSISCSHSAEFCQEMPFILFCIANPSHALGVGISCAHKRLLGPLCRWIGGAALIACC